MSYHNNYNGYNRGGFRNNNNSYGFNRNNGFHRDEQRINETDVPQSKHTIFIRGLHGDTSTDQIQDFIGQKIGRVSFDFVKMAQDGSKIFVAVRFEKRDEAKLFMETYSTREFMGVRCELSWFRDIRRFCAYQRARQQRSNSQRRRRRSDSEESNDRKRRSESPPIRRRSRSQESESPERRGSRSPSRSESPEDRNEDNRISRTRNRSDSRRKSRSSTRSSGGRSQISHRSRSSHRSQSSQRSASSRRSDDEGSRVSSRAQSRVESRAESTAESRRSRRNSETVAQKRRRESSATSIKEEVKEKKIPKKESPLRIPLPTKTTPIKNSPSPASQKSGYIPPPSTDMDIDTSPQHTTNSTNPYPQHQQFQNYKPESTTYSMPMDEDAPPKMIIREATPTKYYPTAKVAERSESLLPTTQPPASSSSLLPPAVAAPPVAAPSVAPVVTMPTPPSFVPRQIGRIEIVMPASLPLPPPAPPVVVAQVTPPPPPPPPQSSLLMDGSAMADGSNAQQQQQLPSTNKLFGHLKSFQSALLSTVKYEIPIKKEDGEITGLRLSSMTSNDEDVEVVKAMEREQKLCRLNDDQMMRFLIQKKKFETAFRNDCETYAVVTRALLSKDESMQFTLKMSLHENMEDLHKQFMKRVDDHLDQLLAC